MAIGMYLDLVHCDEGTSELTPDEPYVLTAVVDLANSVNVQGFPVPIPAFEVVLNGPFENFTNGKTGFAHFTPDLLPSFWDVTGKPAPLTDPNKAIFVVSLMENDDGHPEALRAIVKGVVGSSIFGTLGSDRATQVAKLIHDVSSALETPTGGPNFDDKIGDPQELSFSAEELGQAAAGQTVSKTLTFVGDGGRYVLTFAARAFETQLRRFLQTRGFDLSKGFDMRSLQPPVTSVRAFIQV
jgi:hypothetical protein